MAHKAFPFTDNESIDKISKRLWVERRTRTARNNDRIKLCTVFSHNGYATMTQHHWNMEIIHFKGYIKGYYIKLMHRALCFNTHERSLSLVVCF